jgi:hypothetical protein
MTNVYHENAPDFSGLSRPSTLTAFFDSRSNAENAIRELKDVGVSDVRLVPGYEADAERAEVAGDEPDGFWAKLEGWLFPDEDRDVYAEGLRRGGFLVSATVDDATYNAAYDILDDEGAIDMDERADLWRTEGWSGRKSAAAQADARHDQKRVTGAEHDRQAAASQDDVFKADAAARSATGVGRYSRSPEQTSPRVRAYELQDLPADVVDDIIPTGHQRTVAERERPADRGVRQSEELDDLRQKQSLPRGR